MKTFKQFILEAETDIFGRTPEEIERIKKRESGRGFDTDREAQRRRNAELRKAKVSRQNNPSTQTSSSSPITKPSGTTPPPNSKPSAGTPPKAGPLATRQTTALSTNVKPPVQKIKTNVPGGKKIPGLRSGSALSGVLSTADEKMKGSGWLRSLAKGATVAAGTALGGLAGGAAGTAVAPGAGTAIGGYAGQAAGAALANKAFDVAAGANAAERKAMATQNRQRQAGGGLSGIGGKTTFSKGKDGTGFMSTGSGSQRKTVQLAKTSVVKDPKTGRSEVGNLAFKDGKAVYKRSADPSTLAKTSSNPFERIGRTIAPGAYKKNDEKMRQQKLRQASQSDIKRQQALGVSGSKNLVGPKIVGPKIVGPKKVGPTKPAPLGNKK
jgi:hypothetical protein